MEEIQIGEYIRTKKGYIYKIKMIKESEKYKNTYRVREYGDNYNFLIKKENIIKHSKNIIDLILETDFVNGQKVVEKKNPQKCNSILLSDGSRAENQDIETVLTHEQYNNNCYRIGE